MHFGIYKNGSPNITLLKAEWMNIVNLKNSVVYHQYKDVDLCGILLNRLKFKEMTQNPIIIVTPDNVALPDTKLIELTSFEEVFIMGFPEGLTDNKTGLLLIRNGITAYHPGIDFNGKSMGLLDVTSYPWSSGSPVLIFNQGSIPTQNGIIIGSRSIFLWVLIGYSHGSNDI